MNLVIGSTSQLAHYFPEDYVKISSRNIDLDYLASNTWDSVYITFAEQRIYDTGIDYITPNYIYTREIIDALVENSNKIVCYTSAELFNKCVGKVGLNTLPNFAPITNEYILSKLLLWNKILELRKINRIYEKVIFVHPFYFNSVHRSCGFLFGKIFDSIINKKKIEVGSLDIVRDMVHTRFTVEKSIETKSDCMVGSGKLFYVREFIEDLYRLNNMNFNSFVQENVVEINPGSTKLIRADVEWDYTYTDLINDTMADIEKAREKKWKR